MQTTYFGASVLLKVLLAQSVMSGLTLFVNVLIAIGTIGAVIVALFGNWLRFRMFPPILNIRLLDPEGEGPLPVTRHKWWRISGLRPVVSLPVSNGRRWIPLRTLMFACFKLTN